MKSQSAHNRIAPQTFTPLRHILAVLTALAAFLPATMRAQVEGGGYLIATAKDGSNSEKIHFAISKNGRTWSALNQAKPILTSDVGENGVFYPSLLRLQDGKKFVLLATDMSLTKRNLDGMTAPGQAIADASTNGSHSLVIWESADLVSWDGPRLVDVAPQDAGCAWSPQAIYDPDSKDYMVFWSSTTHGDRTPLQRIWSCRTKDFKNFSPAEVYLDRKGGAMDLNIVQDGTKFFRIFKDMGLNRLVMETSASIAGPWDPVPDFSLSQTPGVNSPECFALKPEPPENKKTWCLFVNSYLETPGGFRPFLSEDLSSGNFTEAEGFSFPFIFRNGSVLPISHAEYSRIENAFGSN